MSSRKKIGIVLGAGGARGFAHIGVLQVLEEAGIPIDVITGCSMGALVGGLYASGSELKLLAAYATRFNLVRYLDFSITDGGFLRGKRIEQLITLLTKRKRIEDACIPYACVAVDLQNGKIRTFDKGSMYQAIRASISIPGVFAPYEIGGRLYVDGGLIERLPIRAAKDLGADITIVVDVNYRGYEQSKPRNLIDTLRHSMSIADWTISRENEKQADYLILPDVSHIDPISTRHTEECIELGKKAARKSLPEIRRLLNNQ